MNTMVHDTDRSGLQVSYRFKQQLPNEWWALKKSNFIEMTFRDIHLPYFATTQKRAAKIEDIKWFVSAPG